MSIFIWSTKLGHLVSKNRLSQTSLTSLNLTTSLTSPTSLISPTSLTSLSCRYSFSTNNTGKSESHSFERRQTQLPGEKKSHFFDGTNETEVMSGRKIRHTWANQLLLTILTSTIVGTVTYTIVERKKQRERIATANSEYVGKPKLGGPWTLTDHNGKEVSDEDFRGKYQIVYFGFTYCPDICPQELEKQSEAVEILDKKYGEIIQPIMITVDPQRDTPEKLKEYCEEFHPRLMGFTGTPDKIKEVAKLFRVYFNTGIKSSEGDYLVDHSIISYIIGKDGKFVDFYGKNMTVLEIVKKLTDIIEGDKLRGA
eukprot:GHVN01063258.1.p1 GENE.GHVN01063258.1~~GHVN01063258.1.p1  ORF type:complete len:311 (+),score=55.93 GHVN01063258.1:431-1363(+)